MAESGVAESGVAGDLPVGAEESSSAPGEMVANEKEEGPVLDVHPAHHAAEALGCLACCDNATDDWPVERAADYLLLQLEELRKTHPGRRVAVIADGEVSSPVSGDGVGGRNAAFVLACVPKISGKRIAVLSVGTDGVDGNSPAAGAVADGDTPSRAASANMDAADYLRRSDAYTYFSRLGDAIVIGPTGNNLRDLRILIAEP